MSSINRIPTMSHNFESPYGARRNLTAETQLNRLVLASMLWEDGFYLDGKTQAELIKDLVPKVDAEVVAKLAEKARGEFKLRHMPLLLVRELARAHKLQATTLTNVIQRADEMGEFLSLYWKDGKTPISNQVKKGLANAFVKFNEYALAKNDKNSAAVSIRDVMFLCHPKPITPSQEAMFKRVAEQKLATPDTWETQLSAGANKKETFERLMREGTLGALAFLRNLRNMTQANVSEDAIRQYAKTLDVSKVLPFRFIAAAKVAPQLEDMLEERMLKALASTEKLPGKTVLLVDVSGSMFGTKVSAKSDLDRFDAAAALAMLCNEVCERAEIYTFSDSLVRVAPRSGFALHDALITSQPNRGTALGQALRSLQAKGAYDRIIVITDEQAQDAVGGPKCDKGYILNVGNNQNGVNRGDWTTITGWSEHVFKYIVEEEKLM